MNHWVRTLLEELLWSSGEVSEQVRKDTLRVIQLFEEREVHEFRTAELATFADRLEECIDISELSNHMWNLTTSIGFQDFAIFVLSQARGASFDPRICTSFNQKWINHYIECRYQYVDPVMTRASQADGWFLFSDLPTSSPMVQEFWRDAAKHRIGKNGLCFATTRLDGTRVGVSFSSEHVGDEIKKIVQLNVFDLKFLVQLATDSFCFCAAGPTIADDILSVPELRFLQVLATSPNPEDAIKVQSPFGPNDSLQASIRHKLKVETVFQAIAIAASRGWFDALPYSTQEVAKTFPPLLGLKREIDNPDVPRVTLASNAD